MPSRRHRRQTGPMYRAINSILSALSNSATLRGTAAVVGNRRDVADRLHLDANRLQRADRRLAAGPRSLHAHLYGPQPIRLGRIAGIHRGLRRGEWRSLARALEADAAGARPRDD